MRFHVRLLVLVLVAAWPLDAAAQIHAWRDANGTLVVSDHPINEATVIYPVGGSTKCVTTTPVEIEVGARALRALRDRAFGQAWTPTGTGPCRHSGRIGIQPPRALAEGRDGTDATDAGDGAVSLGVNRPCDPAENIGGGTRYLRLLLDKYDGDEVLALAAYNAGSGAVDRHGRKVPRYRETQDYVRKVTLCGGRGAGRRAAKAEDLQDARDHRRPRRPRYSERKARRWLMRRSSR